jgi:hypothetical protein
MIKGEISWFSTTQYHLGFTNLMLRLGGRFLWQVSKGHLLVYLILLVHAYILHSAL